MEQLKELRSCDAPSAPPVNNPPNEENAPPSGLHARKALEQGSFGLRRALSLQLVVAQRLVRVICKNCSEDHVPTPSEHEWLRVELGVDVDAHTYKHGTGCTYCNGTGYLGRTGVYEFLEMTKSLVEAVNHSDLNVFYKAAREQMAGNTLGHDAMRLVVDGRTTIDEAMRISNESED